MSTNEIHFNEIFKIMVKAMRLNKSHPNIPRNLKWFCEFGILYGILVFGYTLLIYTVFQDVRNRMLSQACANGVLCVIFYVISLKYFMLVWHQKRFRGLIEKMQIDFDLAKEMSHDDLNVVFSYAKRGRNIVYLWFYITRCATIIYLLKPIVIMIYYSSIGKFRLVPLCYIAFPGNHDVQENNVVVFIALNILFLFYYVYSTTIYVSFSPLGPILILHGCGQLELVKRRILNTFSNYSSSFDAVSNLKIAARHLSETYDFVRSVDACLRTYHELLFKSVVVILPILLYQMIEAFKSGQISVEFLSIIFGAGMLVNVPCYYSDMLMQKSDDVRMALYSCGWESHWDRQSRTLIFLLLTRVTRPVAMHTMFSNISLDGLTDIYRQAYALFNLLNAAWN